jgi:hypothetical protein
MIRVVLTLVCLIAAFVPSHAQELGTVLGRVTDHTGQALPGAIVSLSSSRRGPARETVTSNDGQYRFDGVESGRYQLSFALLGFANYTQRVDVTSTLVRLDATLHVALQAEVTVTGRRTFRNLAELAQPESSLVGFAASASEGAVTGRQLERRPIQRPGEIVETVPGVTVTQHSGEGKANQYYLRGFNLDHGTDFATMVAGVPVNLPTHAHGHGYTDINFLIPELVTGVQYFKGPY